MYICSIIAYIRIYLYLDWILQNHCFLLSFSIRAYLFLCIYVCISDCICTEFLIFCRQDNMRNEENTGHVVRDKRAIASLSLTYKRSTILQIHHLSRKVRKPRRINLCFWLMINRWLIIISFLITNYYFLINKFPFFRAIEFKYCCFLSNSFAFFVFFVNIEVESTMRPTLHSSRSIRLLIFCRSVIRRWKNECDYLMMNYKLLQELSQIRATSLAYWHWNKYWESFV